MLGKVTSRIMAYPDFVTVGGLSHKPIIGVVGPQNLMENLNITWKQEKYRRLELEIKSWEHPVKALDKSYGQF